MVPTLALTPSALFAWVVLPLLIFAARATDVGLATLRLVFIYQGRTTLAPLVGFFESLLWLLVIAQVLPRLDNPLCVVAYAAGFAAGNSLGLNLERRLAIGMQVVRIITQHDAGALIEDLKATGFGLTVVDGQGAKGPVKILFTVARRRDLPQLTELIQRHNPRAFFSVEDVRQAREGIFPRPRPFLAPAGWPFWRGPRKSN